MRLIKLIFFLGVLWDSDVFLHGEPKDYLINGIPASDFCQKLNNGDEIRFGFDKNYYWIVGKSDGENFETAGYYRKT